ncbi:MAG: endonuclease V [Candidatus Hermodarchaeia archaeon]|jgi:deoxyribonuclease V
MRKNLDLDEKRRILSTIADKVIVKDIVQKPITTVAGIDTAFLDNLAITAGLLMKYPSFEVIKMISTKIAVDFPYIPKLLSFREGPLIINLIEAMEEKPDIFFINAHGIAHPMFCGCASYVGVIADVPTIGIASQNLCGEYNYEPEEPGQYTALTYHKRKVGWVYKSKKECRPIFISPGHQVSHEQSLTITMNSINNHKLPEPLHQAHLLANREKKAHRLASK